MLVAYVLLAWEHQKYIIYIFLQKLKDHFAQLFSPLGWKQYTLSWSGWQETRSFRLGAFPWDFLVSWLNIQEGKHGDEVIEASKTFSGWSCCCASLAAECEPWSPQRVGGETQFHEVVLTGHTTMHVFAWNFTDGIEMTWIVSVLVPIPCLLLLRFVTGRTVCIVFYRYMHSHTRPGRFYYNTQRIGLSIYILQCQRK